VLRSLQILAVLGCFILAGFGLAAAMVLIWPAAPGIFMAGLIIAGASASGGYATALIFRCGTPPAGQEQPS